MGENHSYFERGRNGGPTRPVEQVTQTSSQRFCKRLGMTLPTEARWEYACRAGTDTPWSSGAGPEDLQYVANVADASYAESGSTAVADWDDGFGTTAPVGSFAPNPFGLHDMHGNVWEWCLDCYAADSDYDGARHRPGDGLREEPDCRYRIMRGGSFTNLPEHARSSMRLWNEGLVRHLSLGLRPCRGLAP
jgi:formylglycine-generating enzyme required for sulfatase activity